jgi:hypothetical protein
MRSAFPPYAGWGVSVNPRSRRRACEAVVRWMLSATIPALVAPDPANAMKGAQLYEWCFDSKESFAKATCTTYVRGFVDGIVMGIVGAIRGDKVCIPKDGISIEQAKLILKKYLEAHPEFLHEEAGYLFGFALSEAFRCQADSGHE